MPSRPLVIGLTGGIGSGKSAVADAFAAMGVPVTDTDALAHALTAPGARGHQAVLETFGASFRRPDGTIDRAELRRHVFSDAAARTRLESILHPLIRAAAQREIDEWTAPYGLLVVPLLLERTGGTPVDRVLVVDCPEEEQVRRVQSGEEVIVGVNRWTGDAEEAIELHAIDPEGERRQSERTRALRASRDSAAVESALAAVRGAADGEQNLLPPMREALRARATVGEVCGVLRDAWGTYDALRARP